MATATRSSDALPLLASTVALFDTAVRIDDHAHARDSADAVCARGRRNLRRRRRSRAFAPACRSSRSSALPSPRESAMRRFGRAVTMRPLREASTADSPRSALATCTGATSRRLPGRGVCGGGVARARCAWRADARCVRSARRRSGGRNGQRMTPVRIRWISNDKANATIRNRRARLLSMSRIRPARGEGSARCGGWASS